MDKPVIKEIKRILVIIVDSNATAASWVDCGIYNMQALDFLSRSDQDLTNRGLSPDISLFHNINVECTNF